MRFYIKSNKSGADGSSKTAKSYSFALRGKKMIKKEKKSVERDDTTLRDTKFININAINNRVTLIKILPLSNCDGLRRSYAIIRQIRFNFD